VESRVEYRDAPGSPFVACKQCWSLGRSCESCYQHLATDRSLTLIALTLGVLAAEQSAGLRWQ
jgi:hypothetical protein